MPCDPRQIRLLRIIAPTFVAGVVFDAAGYVTAIAPILRRWIKRDMSEAEVFGVLSEHPSWSWRVTTDA